MSRAPTKCELDKRSGRYPTSFCDGEQASTMVGPQSIAATSNVSRTADLPVREGPVVAKVWVADQILDGGHWMQGTWIFVEVESSRWSGEVRRVKSSSPLLGEKKASRGNSAFNPVSEPTAPSSVASSTRAGRGGDK